MNLGINKNKKYKLIKNDIKKKNKFDQKTKKYCGFSRNRFLLAKFMKCKKIIANKKLLIKQVNNLN